MNTEQRIAHYLLLLRENKEMAQAFLNDNQEDLRFVSLAQFANEISAGFIEFLSKRGGVAESGGNT